MDSSVSKPEVAAEPAAKRVSARWPLISGFSALALAVAIGALITLREKGKPLWIDVEWLQELVEHRSPFWNVPSLVMNYIGAGIIGVFVVPVLIVAILLFIKRPWAAGYYLLATLVSSGLVQLLKHLFGRARPEDILVISDFGSFPSGHVANAAVMATTLAIIFPKTWVWVAGAVYTVIMLLSRTYLGAHWLSDTIGGMLLGVGVAVALWAPFAAKLNGERHLAPAKRG
ncbi:phosphatase PAP2 family protein [Glaciibacter sp. 2TAF33]|uniref:phosphatase PAP2 family protein n=1 Tax=Glaciibacter sp. 2TAF33 TaxID=3233015 RepID=UPI003F90D558